MKQYIVKSKIVKLEQIVRSVSKFHYEVNARTVEWLKFDDDEEYFTKEEASQLIDYLDSKKINFKDNDLILVDENNETSIRDLISIQKNLEDGKTFIEEPILIYQCPDLKDYKLPFSIEGYLNDIDLT